MQMVSFRPEADIHPLRLNCINTLTRVAVLTATGRDNLALAESGFESTVS